MNRLLEEANSNNFDINKIRDYDNVTPAHVAVSKTRKETFLYLTKMKSDFINDSTKDWWGHTPYEWAVSEKEFEIIDVLMKMYDVQLEEEGESSEEWEGSEDQTQQNPSDQ